MARASEASRPGKHRHRRPPDHGDTDAGGQGDGGLKGKCRNYSAHGTATTSTAVQSKVHIVGNYARTLHSATCTTSEPTIYGGFPATRFGRPIRRRITHGRPISAADRRHRTSASESHKS